MRTKQWSDYVQGLQTLRPDMTIKVLTIKISNYLLLKLSKEWSDYVQGLQTLRPDITIKVFLTKKLLKEWLCSRFANTASKQSLLPGRLSQPPDAFKQRAPRGFTSHLPGSLYFLWYRFSIIVTFAGIVTKYHPFITSHTGPYHRLPPASGVGPCQSKPSNITS